ncbi:hypothetical protein RDI58_014957 [Solanum bulbocastanum]|uniref:Uncharacterized protein n=1 Tax=Solanum bulbocastanum TaxID=147425 RepID=A0AAN8YBH9_SOLBU
MNFMLVDTELCPWRKVGGLGDILGGLPPSFAVWGNTGSKIYGPKAGLDYLDNELRFNLLCRAALEAPSVLNLNTSNYFSGPYGNTS